MRIRFNINKIMCYLVISSSIWNTSLFSFNTIIGEVSLYQILVLLCGLVILMKSKIKLNNFIKKTITIFIFIIIYGFCSLFWTNNMSIGINKLIHLLTGILFLVEILIFVKYEKMYLNILRCIDINYIIVLLFAVFEIFSGKYFYANNLIQTYNTNIYGLHFPLVFTNNTNDLSVFLVIFSPIIFYFLANAKNLFIKIERLFVIVIALFVIINTTSRLNTFIIICFVIYLIKKLIEKKFIKKQFNLLTVIGILTIITCIILVNQDLINSFLENILLDVRVKIYYHSFNNFIRSFGLGLGVGGTYNTVVDNINNIHNYILEILFEYGIISFGLYIYWLKTIYTNLNELKKNNNKLSIILKFYNILILFIFVWGSVTSTLTSCPFIWLFYVIICIPINLIETNVEVNRLSKK